MKQISKDLTAEYDALDNIIKDLTDDQWLTQTPFFNWRIKDEISHIAYFDRAAYFSATDAAAFQKDMEKMLEGFVDYSQMHKKVNALGDAMSPQDLLAWWRKTREQLIDAYESLSPKDRLPWYGPSMSAKSSATARLMETWAHGQDIVDTLQIKRDPTDRLQHIAHIGFKTYEWSFKNRQIAVPETTIRLELKSPSGDIWEWGDPNASNRVYGDVDAFCLVVTQRRNFADLDSLKADGSAAKQWMQIAQAFAGPPENPPPPGKRV
ncbi:MAG: wyosine base formation [Candidatus Magnetoglobus multicellularis str. Araruama]|uniref:Wyosine base formation n=1 Tax=Candidatus Magnetoglobus multicellularis str. Araruama TaxID=890399 RepID=A0A1V1P7J9_9BACT|nr:MAG: wyosine base formation [Candidatus Magnetoglobus multicellularis str. Araruama]